MRSTNRNTNLVIFCFFTFLFPAVCLGADTDQTNEIAQLKAKINEQDSLIRQLVERVVHLENTVPASSAPAAPSALNRVSLESEELGALPAGIVQKEPEKLPLKISGYIDMGYIDQSGKGTVSTSALHINSRADTLASVGLDGDSSYLVNEVNLNIKAGLSPKAEAVSNVSFLPRKLTFTATGGTALTDAVGVNLAYLAYRPFEEGNFWTDTLLGDLNVSIGKFDSPWGIEYRYNFSPDRVNISRSMMSIYWTGYPVGVKVRGKLLKEMLQRFQNSEFTYNFAVVNGEPWIASLVDMDRATSKRRTLVGRLSYGLDIFDGFFESGFSFANGARINQGDEGTNQYSLGADVRFERGPWTTRAEIDYSDLDAARNGSSQAIRFQHWYVESFYEISKPGLLPSWVPVVSLTPYYRYDRRYLTTLFSAVFPAVSVTNVGRNTLGLRYILRSGTMLKLEYELVSEKGTKVNDDIFLASFVQEF